MNTSHLIPVAIFAAAVSTAPLAAQQASFVYRLGKDTAVVEQYTRTANRLSGDVVSRTGPVVVHTKYDATYAADGRLVAATYIITGADGKPIKGRISEVRYVIKGDSAQREVVWADSTQNRTLAAQGAVLFVSYGMLEPAFIAMRRGKMPQEGFTLLRPSAAPVLARAQFVAAGGDTLKLTTGDVFLVDREGRLQSYDGTITTQKFVATRAAGGLDIASLASRMTPTGVLSSRGTARAAFQTQMPGGVVMVDYGRPQVRERSVWGGLLIPLDTIWRLGANEATHFATSRELDFGGISVPAGLYTLFLFNAKSGPQLVINKQVGQWGTIYDAANDLVRIPLTMSATPEHVEEFTINIRQAAPSRGALEFAWGSQMASTNFTVK